MRALMVAILALAWLPWGLAAAQETGPRFRAAESLRYAEGARGTLDVYAPAEPANAPVVVFFYGGGWQHGDKARMGFVGDALAAQGFVVVVPDYRVWPEVRFPGFIQDAAAAIRWTQDHIAEHGGDPTRIVLAGHSAGGHIATLVALDPSYLEAAGVDRRNIRGVIGMSAPYYHPAEFRDQRLCDIFCSAALWSDVEPMTFLSADDPPLLLMVGDQDAAVPPLPPVLEAAERAGARVEHRLYPGVDHGGTIRGFIDPTIAPSPADFTAFARQVTN